jgi:hypothetical protein
MSWSCIDSPAPLESSRKPGFKLASSLPLSPVIHPALAALQRGDEHRRATLMIAGHLQLAGATLDTRRSHG